MREFLNPQSVSDTSFSFRYFHFIIFLINAPNMTSAFSGRVTKLNLKVTSNCLEMNSKKVPTGDKSRATADKTHTGPFFFFSFTTARLRHGAPLKKKCPLVWCTTWVSTLHNPWLRSQADKPPGRGGALGSQQFGPGGVLSVFAGQT